MLACTNRISDVYYKKVSRIREKDMVDTMNLSEAELEKEYIVKDINTDDEELKSFLFTLGCYSGEPITVISHVKGGCVVSIKDARYNIDTGLAKAISI